MEGGGIAKRIHVGDGDIAELLFPIRPISETRYDQQ